MAVLQNSDGSTSVGAGAEAASGLHVIAKPQATGVYGHYQVAVTTGAVAAGASADSEVFQFWWNTTLRVACIERVWVTGMYATTAFAAGAILLKLTRATDYTVAGSGGTALTLSSPSLLLRAGTMGVTGASDIRVADTAALTPGTATLDGHDMGLITTHSSGGVGSAAPIIGSIYLPTTELFRADVASGEYPLTLGAEEGFVVRATVPATGVWVLGLGVKWFETGAF